VTHEPSRSVWKPRGYEEDVNAEYELKEQWESPLYRAVLEIHAVIDDVREQQSSEHSR